MAVATGSQIRPELSAVDYTPFQQAAGQAAQMQAQGIAAASSGLFDAVRQYSQNKMASDALEGENAQMLALLQQVPEYRDFAPNKDILDKYQKKLVEGGLSLADNKKLNAELNVAFKVGDRVLNYRQQQEYAKQAKAATDRMTYEMGVAKRDREVTDQFNIQLAQVPQGELTPERIYEIGVQLGASPSVVNAAVGGKLDIGRYNIALEAKRANEARNQVETDLLKRQLEIAQKADPKGTVEIVEQDGIRGIKVTDPMGKVDFKPVTPPKERISPEVALQDAVTRYQTGLSTNNEVMKSAAVAAYAKIMGFTGPGWTTEAVEEEFVNRLIKNAPQRQAPARGPANITSAAPVRVEQKAPGAAAAPAAPNQPETPVRTTGGQASAQPNLPPQPVTPYTPAADVRQQEDAAALQAFFAAQKALPQQGVGQAVNDYTAALVQNAPPAPVVDTNLFVGPHTAGKLEPSMRYGGYDYPAMSVLGGVERLASFLGPVEQQIQAPGRALNELGQYGSAALTGLFTGDYTVPEQGLVDIASQNIAKYLSGSNLPGETVRTLGQAAGMIPESGNAPLPNEVTNLPSATLDAMASGMESVSAARERMRREDANMRLERRRASTAQPEAARPMKSAELPQISLSKDAKRIADLLLQEYENNKGGKAPTFTITAARPGGKETSIKLSNPAILAIMSNPTNFGGMIRGNVEQFSQQNARMNQILAEMEAARAARTRTVRGR